ncbi:hypothetical protein [Mycobacterium haemophilum]|uniref:Uncharacterized protein n=1 Tax=Mycobacterium haemophilum TaxID=29311 RepID=A0A0I9UQG4_9MYCO|nr:hypothetical protein [Mycobacterium haemophilum]AKN17773.1 hypothetical protein B586_16230 [Mycobacterium haemophilum DSM 44634]KLO33418.1 hypothetical protein ABH39_00755 [Mycobacterium haemophilum]KLO38942.1 hypothetical protein ABH38_00755 [Mycobacterium haemophilum]KLO45359.1 hypothetical protein ABH37_00755 [Mycobacterium haemophilum]KLO56509.1 hypothetical protein ABH36_00755 [Mycobacterium haemophilum]
MASEVVRFIGVFNADGGVRGGLAYVLGKLRGTTSCALCDVTHRGVWTNPEWKDVTCALGAPFDLVCRNERSAEVERLTGDLTPAVVAQTSNGYQIVMGPNDFAGVSGDAHEFIRALRRACIDHDLAWPGVEPPEFDEAAR